LIHFFISF